MFGAVASHPHAPLHAIGTNDPTIADWPIQKYRQHSGITRVFANRADNNPPPTTAPLGQHHISTTSSVARAFAPWGRPWVCWPIPIRKKCGQPSKTKKKKKYCSPQTRGQKRVAQGVLLPSTTLATPLPIIPGDVENWSFTWGKIGREAWIWTIRHAHGEIQKRTARGFYQPQWRRRTRHIAATL